MKKNTKLYTGVVIVLALLFLLGGSVMSSGGWSVMSGSGGLMNSRGYVSSPLDLIGMSFMWLVPVGLIILSVFGIIWLAQDASNSIKPPTS